MSNVAKFTRLLREYILVKVCTISRQELLVIWCGFISGSGFECNISYGYGAPEMSFTNLNIKCKFMPLITDELGEFCEHSVKSA